MWVITDAPAPVDAGALACRTRDTLRLTWEERRWTRKRVVTTAGREIALALPTGTVLEPGDVLAVEQQWYLIVEPRPEPVLALFPESYEAAVRIAFDVGNRHFSLGGDEDTLLVPAPFEACLLPRPLDQNAPHGLRGGHEEMVAAVPILLGRADEPQPGFMDQSGRLQGITSGLLRHVVGGESSKFLIDQRQQFLRGFAIALLDAFENLGDIAHATELKRPAEIEESQKRIDRAGAHFRLRATPRTPSSPLSDGGEGRGEEARLIKDSPSPRSL